MNVDLRSYAVVGCLLLSCCLQSSLSARADEAEPAAQNIRFVLEDEPYVTGMPEDYQPQEDLRYAAVVRGFAPILLSHQGHARVHPLNQNGLTSIASIDSSRSGSRLRAFVNKGLARHRFKSTPIYDYGPDIAAPGGPHVAVNGDFSNAVSELGFLMSAQGMPPTANFWNRFTPAQEGRPPLQEYALLAPSVEEAKQLAADFLHAYDQGFVPWLQKLTQEQKAALERSRNEAEGKRAELDKKVASLAKEVEGVEELAEQAISDLKVKRMLLKVELAGVEARVKTIEEKLKEASDHGLTQLGSKLVDLKVSADVDRASLAAQQKVLDELIDGQRRLKERGRLNFERREYAGPIRTAAEGLPRCDEILAALKPFQLENDAVVIRPLRFRAE